MTTVQEFDGYQLRGTLTRNKFRLNGVRSVGDKDNYHSLVL